MARGEILWMLGLFTALWELESITPPRTAEKADQLCRWAFFHPEPVVRDLARSQLPRISPRLQRSLLQDWGDQGLVQEVGHCESWAYALEQQYLYGGWPDGVPIPRQRTLDENTSAAYRLLLGGYPDPNRVQDHYLRADSAGKRRLVGALQGRGRGGLVSDHHRAFNWGPDRDFRWDEQDIKFLRVSPEIASFQLWIATPAQAQLLLPCLDPRGEEEPGRTRILQLAAAAPTGPLHLRYPRPVRLDRQVFRGPVSWFGFRGESLLVLEERLGRMWVWPEGKAPRPFTARQTFSRGSFACFGKYLVSLHPDAARLWEVPSGREVWAASEFGGSRAARLQLSPDQRFALAMAPESGFAVLELATGKMVLRQSQPVRWGVFPDPLCVLVRRERELEAYLLDPVCKLASSYQNRTRAHARYHRPLWKDDPRIQSLSARWQKVDFLPVRARPNQVALSPSGKLMAVRRGPRMVTLYRLRGDGHERVRGWDAPYYRPANPDERFAQLLGSYQDGA